jgi:hypothetical protein
VKNADFLLFSENSFKISLAKVFGLCDN